MSIVTLAELVFAGLTLVLAIIIVHQRLSDRRENRSRLGILMPTRLTLGAILAAKRGARRRRSPGSTRQE